MEVVALLAAGLAVCVRLVLLWATDGGAPAPALVVLGLLAVLPVGGARGAGAGALAYPAAAVAGPSPSRSSVVALIPVTLGAFGLYSLLFGAS